ncbi:Peptidase S24-like protein [Bacteroides salyersiae]|uniref:S24 family peptidase n=1 Tax=Bacteroides salyersiae TaxID=291644 RepID=UPI00201E5B9B|nr:S24 family peptidase [Bacteroides salyersiae]MCS2403772.1 peptidase S24 [Bacteroides salyersiae]QUT76921.1 Peptidase S24-like protein [Bacteroides salyersiae]
METSKDRLKMFIKHLKIGQTKFEQNTGISRGYISKIKESIGTPILNKITSSYPELNTEWLISGNGKMLNEKDYVNEISIPVISTIMNVKLVGQYAQAGYLCGYNDPEYMDSLPTIPFAVDTEHKGNYICFEVRGDSMDDGSKYSYEQGDIVLCREVSQEYWKSRLHYTHWNAFVLIHKTDGILIKQIIAHDVERGIITIHSFNDLYPDREIDLKDIKAIYNVVKTQKNR